MSENHAAAHESHDHTKIYMIIWAALGVLTILEIGVAVEMRGAIMVLLLVGMASLKAVLVARYYMHLKFEPSKLAVLAAAPGAFLAIMSVMVVIEAIDMPVSSVHTQEGQEAVARLLEAQASGTLHAEPKAEGESAPAAVPAVEAPAAEAPAAQIPPSAETAPAGH